MDGNAGSGIRDFPHDLVGVSQLITMGSESDTLNDSVYIQLSRDDFIWLHIRLVTRNFQSRQPLSAGLFEQAKAGPSAWQSPGTLLKQ